MKRTINFQEFVDVFRDYGRDDIFSRDGLRLLFDYLEEIDENYEPDVIALCCDYQESTPEEVVQDYGIDTSGADAEDLLGFVEQYLAEATSVVGVTDDAIIFLSF